MVVHTIQEAETESRLEASLGKRLIRPCLKNKPPMCTTTLLGGRGRKITVGG
jgi:hypothetical protein